MGKINAWALEQEELVWNAVNQGITNYDNVLLYVEQYIIADSRYVRKIFNEAMGFDRLTEDALDDVSEGHNSDMIDGYNRDDIGESPDY